LDAGSPYNGWILGGRLRFDSEEEAEKVPVGFDSKEGFTEMDKNRDVANRVRVEMMELKPVVVKEAMEKRTREGCQLTRFLSWSNPLETSLLRSFREHLLWVHSPVGGCTSFFFPSFSDFLGAISGSARHELLRGCGERGGEIWEDWDFCGSWQIADWKHSFYLDLPRD
jgi:hypothetical protein